MPFSHLKVKLPVSIYIYDLAHFLIMDTISFRINRHTLPRNPLSFLNFIVDILEAQFIITHLNLIQGTDRKGAVLFYDFKVTPKAGVVDPLKKLKLAAKSHGVEMEVT